MKKLDERTKTLLLLYLSVIMLFCMVLFTKTMVSYNQYDCETGEYFGKGYGHQSEIQQMFGSKTYHVPLATIDSETGEYNFRTKDDGLVSIDVCTRKYLEKQGIDVWAKE